MLNIEICDNKNHKTVYYWNGDNNLIRTTILNTKNNIIQDVICEYDKTGRNICDVLFGLIARGRKLLYSSRMLHP